MIRILGTICFVLLFLITLPIAALSPMAAADPNLANPPGEILIWLIIASFCALSLSFLVAAIGTYMHRGRVSMTVAAPIIPLVMFVVTEAWYRSAYQSCLFFAC
jgi:hypothetical protein